MNETQATKGGSLAVAVTDLQTDGERFLKVLAGAIVVAQGTINVAQAGKGGSLAVVVADLQTDGERFLMVFASVLVVVQGMINVAQVAKGVSLAVLVADFLLDSERFLVVFASALVVAQGIMYVTKTKNGVSLAAAVADLQTDGERFLKVFAGTLVVAQGMIYVAKTNKGIGLAALVARMAVPFRDINNFLPYATRLWLYLSPIIWPHSFLDSAGETLNFVVRLNPMFHLIAMYRTALMGAPLEPGALLVSGVWAVALLLLGTGLFVTYENKMVRDL